MMAFLPAWLFSIISAIFILSSPECDAGSPALSHHDTAQYYLANILSNFMKDGFKNEG